LISTNITPEPTGALTAGVPSPIPAVLTVPAFAAVASLPAVVIGVATP
jgi:hypothetical protein